MELEDCQHVYILYECVICEDRCTYDRDEMVKHMKEYHYIEDIE